MNKYLFLVIKIFIVLAFSVFVLSLSGCEDKHEKDDEPIVSPDRDCDYDENCDADEDDDGDAYVDDDDTDDNDTDTDIIDTDDDTDANTDANTDTDINEDPCQATNAEKINSVVIGTYNTRLFFDKVCDSENCSSSSFESVPNDSEYNAKVSDLADSVKEIGADIILLQEVEKESCLKDLFEKSGDYDEYYLGEKGSVASVDTGVMTKGKITYKNKHIEQIDCADCEDGKTTFSRAFLETHIELGCREIIVFSAHFKSKADDDAPRRLAEAAAAVKILKKTAEKYPDALIVMGGDLNDEPGSDTLDFFESEQSFLRVADELSSKDQATYLYHGNAIALDHIFWVKNESGTYKKGSAKVVKDAPSIYSLGSSDHAALKATFEF